MSAAETRRMIFDFLDMVRDSGQVNMFGTAPIVAEAFGLPLREAHTYVAEWMAEFNDESLRHQSPRLPRA